MAKTLLPPSEGQTVRNDTTYEYFRNGWLKQSTDPWDITTGYDYTERGRQKARTLTSADGSSGRIMAWSYYPDGKLRTRSDDGVPVGKSVALVDNSDSRHASSTGTWTKGANDQADTVTHPDQFSKYTYALREQVKTVSVGKTAADVSPKVSSYTDRGQKLQETKANKITVDYAYFLNGAL
ncbi:hypothetical protein ACFRCI_19715 [Streptomyces sp. NPDC056638]|uniref:hypothetical protein n=1 Tax=Streptomyces sp. NPDC056638 TaxID=3345887 RepID=UPI003696506E